MTVMTSNVFLHVGHIITLTLLLFLYYICGDINGILTEIQQACTTENRCSMLLKLHYFANGAIIFNQTSKIPGITGAKSCIVFVVSDAHRIEF